jgi:hypothetical protein
MMGVQFPPDADDAQKGYTGKGKGKAPAR